MATENKNIPENNEAQAPVEEKPKKKLPSINPKIFTIWLPLYIVQLVAVYFVTAQILMNKVEGKPTDLKNGKDTVKEETKKKSQQPDLGKFLYSIDDVIVNPSGTDGKRLLLASFGFDLKSEEDKQLLKGREILVKDAIISTLSAMSLDQLSSSVYKDTIKTEIGSQIKKMIPELNLNTVYLSKFIIQ
jgi:flagellar protein FliL